MKSIALALSVVALFSATAYADDPVINRAPDSADRIAKLTRVAIIPIDPCPAALECGAVERNLFLEFRNAWTSHVVGATQTRQKMFELGITSFDKPHQQQLATALEVNGFLVPSIPYLGSKDQPAALIWPAGHAPEERVELTLLALDSDIPIFRGTNQGQGLTTTSPEDLASRLFKGIIKQTLPKPKR